MLCQFSNLTLKTLEVWRIHFETAFAALALSSLSSDIAVDIVSEGSSGLYIPFKYGNMGVKFQKKGYKIIYSKEISVFCEKLTVLSKIGHLLRKFKSSIAKIEVFKKGLSSKLSGNCIVAPNLWFFSYTDFKLWPLDYFLIFFNRAKFQQDWTTLILDIL